MAAPETSRNYMGNIQPKGFPAIPADWTSDFETFPSSDGKVQLFAALHRVREPRPGTAARALVIAHGLGEHGGRYLHFPHYLRDAVDTVYCLDHRGHGRSEGLRGYADRFELLAEDLAVAVRRLDSQLRKRAGASEIHLLGHSLGSMIALSAAMSRPDLPIRSLTLSSPMIGIRVKVPFLKRASARALSTAWGTLQLDNELDPKDLSHDPAVVEAYVLDRLVHSKITPRLYIGLTEAMERARREWKTGLNFPLYMVVPMADRITDPEAAVAFFEALENPRGKKLQTYPEFFHESFNELGKERAFEDLKRWIQQSPAT